MQKTIVVSENGMFTSEPINVTDMADLFCAALSATIDQVREQFPEEEAPQINKELFDCLNHSFSRCLEISFPEFELHPEITERVLKMEDELLRAEAAKVTEVD